MSRFFSFIPCARTVCGGGSCSLVAFRTPPVRGGYSVAGLPLDISSVDQPEIIVPAFKQGRTAIARYRHGGYFGGYSATTELALDWLGGGLHQTFLQSGRAPLVQDARPKFQGGSASGRRHTACPRWVYRRGQRGHCGLPCGRLEAPRRRNWSLKPSLYETMPC